MFRHYSCFVVGIRLLLSVFLLNALTEIAPADEGFSAADLDFFEARIRPVLVQHCFECHSGESRILRGGLQLDSRQAMLTGGDSGPAVIPGMPEESLLLQALRHESFEMPPQQKLSEEIINDFAEWIQRGVPDPRLNKVAARLQPVDWEQARQHWAFQPLTDPEPPELVAEDREEGTEAAGEADNPHRIDRFILDRLRQAGFVAAPAADRRQLIRRASYDLIGLPPTPEEVSDFLVDDSPDAFPRVIDRLLASPHYGERWGRHWLDLVRYADTNGADENHSMPNAWQYRDWVIRSINRDLPLDQFIVQQLAGDLLPAPEDELARGDLLAATGMLVVGPKMLAEQDKDKMLIDIVDEQIDTVSRTMLGLTIGCARCHDHKFDPVSARDYYALAGIFYSTQSMADRAFVSKWMERPLPSSSVDARIREHQQQLDAARSQLASLQKSFDSLATQADNASVTESERERLQASRSELEEQIKSRKAEIERLEKEAPQHDLVMAVTEADPISLPIHLRGNHLTLGAENIPRGMPAILTAVASAKPIDAAHSGRLELAQWLVSPQNPLTARVMVNRIWMWHFGEPLMKSPSNWGLQAEKPSHPELLDWLAQELVRSDWSMKHLHRVILQSHTWQQSSLPCEDQQLRDPENRLLWRQNRRRMEAEVVRDSILAVGGSLDPVMGGIADDTNAVRRAVYLPINRSALYEMFSTFDYVETANHIARRPVTTVPQQALFLLNSNVVLQQSRRLAENVLAMDSETTESVQGIELLFQILYSRLPEQRELATAQDFLVKAEQLLHTVEDPRERQLQVWAGLCRTLIASNEFLYIR